MFVAGQCVTFNESVVRCTHLTKYIQSQPRPCSAVCHLGGGALCCRASAATTEWHRYAPVHSMPVTVWCSWKPCEVSEPGLVHRCHWAISSPVQIQHVESCLKKIYCTEKATWKRRMVGMPAAMDRTRTCGPLTRSKESALG